MSLVVVKNLVEKLIESETTFSLTVGFGNLL